MVRLLAGALVTTIAVTMLIPSAQALPAFKTAFEKKYVKTSDNAEFQAVFKKETCNVCHIKGEKEKTKQNAYGKELNKLIEGDANIRMKEARANGKLDEETKKLLDELEIAFKKVEEMKAPSGPTYGELLKDGKFPVTPEEAIAQAKKEAEEEAAQASN
jgi:hypothetical protein